ncbi:GntR family transcriptional regulator [Streptomyces sp. NBC_00059]|uniref:GntR family transcriptional regulator n=1 Tax=Streptomyces sp. NBC_00059 TaxID=2975635 RepID=UPI00225BD63F|nr:GntR family transcriptional regulator [Streptomyces sp. NBC_00059]MCX5414099.1 GntR family transcriptional regulator [Streptomyces sp. NBC_00059]
MAENVYPSEGDAPEDTPDLKFRRLARELRQRIRQGTWSADGRIPTEKQLSMSSGTSVSTVRRAVDELVAEGLVVRRQGSGTFVLPPDAPGTGRALIGVVVPDTTFYYPRVLQGIEETLSAAGARLLLACSGYDQRRECKDLQDMLEAGVDGLLVVPTLTGAEPAERHLAWLSALPVPAVLMERRGTSLGDINEYVCTHHEAGAYDAVRHLAALGHQAVGLALRDPSPTASPVADGFRQAAAELGCVTTVFRASREEWSPATADRCLAGLRAAGASAVVCFGDRQAAMLVGAARRAGLTVPGDLAVVAYDDEIADLADISLTAVAPPKHLLGATAAETLLRRLDNPGLPRRHVMLRPGITVRQSCGQRVPPPENHVGPASETPRRVRTRNTLMKRETDS